MAQPCLSGLLRKRVGIAQPSSWPLNSVDQKTVITLGETIAEAAASTNRRVALIASGDMSHRLTIGAPLGYDPRGREFDAWLVDALRRGAYRDLLQLDPQLEQVGSGRCDCAVACRSRRARILRSRR